MRIERLQVLLPPAIRFLSHAFTKEHEANKLIALDGAGNLTIYTAPFVEQKSQPIPLVFEGDHSQIANVISQGFTSEGIDALVTVHNKGKNGKFSTYLVNSKETKSPIMFNSQSTPMVITNPATLKPLILFTNNNKIEFGEIDENKAYHQLGTFDLSTKQLPYGIHTSSYIDVTGNLSPNLILHSQLNGENNVTVFNIDITVDENNKDNYTFSLKELQNINLNQKSIGPIMFADMMSPIKPDMIFISEENGNYFLNLYENTAFTDDVPENIFSKIDELKKYFENVSFSGSVFSKPPIRFDLSQSILGNGQRKISLNLMRSESMPGMYMADTFGKGIPDIYIVSEGAGSTTDAPKNATIHMIEFNRESKTFSVNMDFANTVGTLGTFDHVTGITMFDVEDEGIPQLMINYENDVNGSHTGVIKFDHSSETTGVSLLPLKSMNNLVSLIPGTSFIIVYENEQKIIKTGVYHQSSYISLQTHYSYVGLNSTNLFINYFLLKTPDNNAKTNTYTAPTSLVPNMFNIFTLKEGGWAIHCFFGIRYFKHALISMILILVLFVSIYIILSIQDNKKYKNVVAKDSMERVFNAL